MSVSVVVRRSLFARQDVQTSNLWKDFASCAQRWKWPETYLRWSWEERRSEKKAWSWSTLYLTRNANYENTKRPSVSRRTKICCCHPRENARHPLALGKLLFDAIFTCFTYVSLSVSATIKIPLYRLKRDDGRIEKSPAQLAIEADLAKKKLLDAPYEDLTDVSCFWIENLPDLLNMLDDIVLLPTPSSTIIYTVLSTDGKRCSL